MGNILKDMKVQHLEALRIPVNLYNFGNNEFSDLYYIDNCIHWFKFGEDYEGYRHFGYNLAHI